MSDSDDQRINVTDGAISAATTQRNAHAQDVRAVCRVMCDTSVKQFSVCIYYNRQYNNCTNG